MPLVRSGPREAPFVGPGGLKLLFDQNLAQKLVARLDDLFPVMRETLHCSGTPPRAWPLALREREHGRPATYSPSPARRRRTSPSSKQTDLACIRSTYGRTAG